MQNNCTLFPEGWWSHCCAAHDLNYGGLVPRIVADETLMQCVVNSSPHAGWLTLFSVFIGTTMYIGVRLFGASHYVKGIKK
jgi:hypothetical protein